MNYKHKITIISKSLFKPNYELILDNYSVETTEVAHFIYADHEQKELRQIIPVGTLIFFDFIEERITT